MIGWLGGIVSGAAKPVSDVLAARQRTEQLRIEAEYRRETSQLDAQSKAIERAATASGIQGLWRPVLMLVLTALVLWYFGQSFVIFGWWFAGIVRGEDWATSSGLQGYAGDWVALGGSLLLLIGAFGGVTSWQRGKEKIAGRAGLNVDGKRSLLARMRAEPPTSLVATDAPITNRTPAVQRLPGVRPASARAERSGFVFGARSREVLSQARVELQAVHERALEISELDFACYESVRTAEKQRENIEKGVSWTMDSRHLERPAGAVDHVPLVDGKACWEWWAFEKTTAALKAAAAELGIDCTHGIDWEPPRRDGPHTELDRKTYPKAIPA